MLSFQVPFSRLLFLTKKSRCVSRVFVGGRKNRNKSRVCGRGRGVVIDQEGVIDQ